MRKYRGLTKDGNWVYGWYYHWNSKGKDFIMQQHINSVDIMHIEVIPETVGQYTGLKDKNSKEIYEGDIMETHTGWKTVVRWDENELMYKGLMSIWKIIDNIYENPKLLEKQ